MFDRWADLLQACTCWHSTSRSDQYLGRPATGVLVFPGMRMVKKPNITSAS
jgi:hypothetical protein